MPVDSVAVSDLDIESFEIFRKETVRTERMTKRDVECSNEELLEKLGLITDGKLKRAAVLLFYRNPQRLFTEPLLLQKDRFLPEHHSHRLFLLSNI